MFLIGAKSPVTGVMVFNKSGIELVFANLRIVYLCVSIMAAMSDLH